MFTKYYENNLGKLINTKFNWEIFKTVFSDLICTLSIFKYKGLFCSSLKPSNIFIEDNNNIKCYFSRISKLNEFN